ncbi:MAG: CoA transferase [Alphaproteobacteria bacterium]|nr:CoA transferase [Alphaproteobacteria bacterium]
MTKPLSHITVLDLSRVLAGPWASQNLADMGARVIKVERPGAGDDTRSWGPPFLKDSTEESAYYLCANRGKQSVTVDIGHPDGQRIIRKLARKSDVVLENFRAGALAKYGLDYENLRKENPALVYCSITGFGQDGPYRDVAGYDFMIQAMGGLMSVTGEPDGAPMRVGVPFADIMTGMYATSAILAALIRRDREGVGQYIDLALFDVQLAALANQGSNYLISGNVPERIGNAHPNIVPYQSFATRDGHMIVAVGNDNQFAKFCDCIGHSELAADPQYTTNAARVERRTVLVPLLAEAMVQKPTHEWLAVLEQAGVPCGPIHRIDEAFAHPQAQFRGVRARIGEVEGVRNPIRFGAESLTSTTPPPQLGEHTDTVLRELLSMAPNAIERLRKEGVV